MDHQRMDALARVLGSKLDRRAAMRGAVAALIGLAAVPATNGAAVCVAVGKGCGGAAGACCDGLVCDSKTSKCLGLAGTTCRISSNCATGLQCKSGLCGGALVCRKMRESCAPVGNLCCATMICDGSQRACLTDLGYACAANGDCANGAVCRGGVCAVKGQAGEVCDEDADCAGSLGCNTGEGKCRAPLNGACTADADCGSGRACIGKVCIVPECPSIPCKDGKVCWNGACVTPQSCEGFDGMHCYETTDGLRGPGGGISGEPCVSVTDCFDSFICNDSELPYLGAECVCMSAYYHYGEFVRNEGYCGTTIIDRIAGDQCTAGGQCARDQYCDNGTCRPMQAGECHSYQDCEDPNNSDCCSGLCYKMNEGVNLEHCGWCGNTCGANQICCDWDCLDVAPGVTTCPV